nr:hypothetical protein [uncultured Haemophilus sp.]
MSERILKSLTEESFRHIDNSVENTSVAIENEIRNLTEGWDQRTIWNETGKLAGILDGQGNRRGDIPQLVKAYNTLIGYWNEYTQLTISQPLQYPKNKDGWLQFIKQKYQ